MVNIRSVDYIITAKHYGGSARGYIKKQQQAIHRQRGIAITIKDLEKDPTGVPVSARIWQGQWIADCECNGASFVDPEEPVFFCFSCANRANGGKPRPVIFPPHEERLEIERLLLERPVDDLAGLTDLERAGMARPVIFVEVAISDQRSAVSPPAADARSETRVLPLVRSWAPGETVEDLHRQQDEPIQKWKREQHGV